VFSLMNEVQCAPLHVHALQGYLAHKETPPPLGPPWDHGHHINVGSYGQTLSHERGTPVSVETCMNTSSRACN